MKMICSSIYLQLIISFVVTIVNIHGLSSPIAPFTNYPYSIELMANTSDLFWRVDNDTKSITFELHIATTGWIGLGIAPGRGMTNADIGLGWIDSSGQLVFQNRHAYGFERPVMNNGTIDWFGLQGREEDGWTAIQMRRLINACDSRDYPIKSGVDILIYAWGGMDPDANNDIAFHGPNASSIVLPLQSYIQPSTEDEFAGLDTVDFVVNNYTLPANQSTYYCQVFKVPDTILGKRHAIAREIIIDSSVPNIVYHLSLNECDREAVFDDNNLPSGPCDDNVSAYNLCEYNIVIGWATGGDYLIEFPEEAGLPIGQNFSTKYYMIQINYYNFPSAPDYTDSSGVRLYIGNEMRPYDLGGLTFGVDSTPESIAIPPNFRAFSIDSYCTSAASLYNFPSTGITVFSFFGHTHEEGVSVWTKVVRNDTAVEYLFNAESYNPNSQFEHRLPNPITVYPGDEFASRCTYSTSSNSQITVGGRLPSQEMCVQIFNYYPRMDNLYTCASTIATEAWNLLINETTHAANISFSDWLQSISWTSALANQWQTFYDVSPRYIAFGRAGFYNVSFLESIPSYQDINNTQCQNNTSGTGSQTTVATTATPAITTTTSMSAETTTTSMAAVTSSTSMSAETTSTSMSAETTSTSMSAVTTSTSIPVETTATSASTVSTSISSTTVNATTSKTSTVFSTTPVMNTTKSSSNNFAVDKTIFILPLLILCFISGRIN